MTFVVVAGLGLAAASAGLAAGTAALPAFATAVPVSAAMIIAGIGVPIIVAPIVAVLPLLIALVE